MLLLSSTSWAQTKIRAAQIYLSDVFAFTGNNTHAGTETFNGAVTMSGGGRLSGSYSGNPAFTGTPTFANFTFGNVTSTSANPAQTGFIRMAYGDGLNMRNSSNSADVTLIGLDSSGNIPIGIQGYGTTYIVSANGSSGIGSYLPHVGVGAPFYVFASAGSGGPGGALYLQGGAGSGSNSGGSVYLQPGSGVSGPGTIVAAGTVTATGTAATLTGTGACATITTQLGGAWAGSFKCTGTTGASTVTVSPGTTAPNGWGCSIDDETNWSAANAWHQTSHTQTTCVLSSASITANDVMVLKSAVAY